ncbi:MAG: hypothetical protein LBD35_05135 [Prevotellaceae bacterium]|jgi:hypothetical protein|nr:hypothetical protein [Prevotellaceae bacterium]
MNQSEEKGKPLARRQFLRACGTALAGGSVIAVSGNLAKKATDKRKFAFGALTPERDGNTFVAPYRLVASFETGGAVHCFDVADDKFFAALPDRIAVFDAAGARLAEFAAARETRDIAVASDGVYLLHPAGFDAVSRDGAPLRSAEACSPDSDYCSFALTDTHVFVTDAANKHICKYTRNGVFVKFIDSPNRFIIPSYTFGIEAANGMIYCSNSGRHSIERFSEEGDYLGSFGKAGGAEGTFAGCCNPVHVTGTPWGDIITSEKGVARISCYGGDGTFRGTLLASRELGRGAKAFDVKTEGDKLHVAGEGRISTFKYDKQAAALAAAAAASCGNCAVNCPLRA